MAGIFPASTDGGLPPDTGNTSNPTHAYAPATPPVGTTALYYGNGCDVRLRPEVLNSIISEFEALCDRASVAYDPSKLTNAERAVRYIEQRGLPRGGFAQGGPNVYTTSLDPPCTAYNNFMVLTIVPAANNQGAVQLNCDNVGLVPLLRNDGAQLVSGDWSANIPVLIGFYAGNFYMLGLCKSQVPLVLAGSLDVWVRTDGSDVTGDGSANSADKAFATLQHAWNTVAGRYAATPTFQINIRMGIPGTYVGAGFASYGGTLNIWGDSTKNNPDAYIISGVVTGGGALVANLGFSALAFGTVTGCCFLVDHASPSYLQTCVTAGAGATVMVDTCNFQSNVSNTNGCYINARLRATVVTQGIIRCRGQNNSIGGVIVAAESSNYLNAEGAINTQLYVQDATFPVGSMYAQASGTIDLDSHQIYPTNTHGYQYQAEGNSIIYARGNTLPGDTAGSVAHNGVFVP